MEPIKEIKQLFPGQKLLFDDGSEKLNIKVVKVDIKKEEIDIECEGVKTWLLISDLEKGHVFKIEPPKPKTKPKTKREINIEFHSKRLGAEIVEYNKYIFIQGEEIKDKFSLVVFGPKGFNPIIRYFFRTFADRAEYAAKYQNDIDTQVEREKVYEIRRNLEKDKIQISAILYSSWGYEQTNIDFYQVIDRRGVWVTLQQIGQIKNYDYTANSGNCIADPETKKGEPFKKKITNYGYIKLCSYSTASIWDGRPLYWSSDY